MTSESPSSIDPVPEPSPPRSVLRYVATGVRVTLGVVVLSLSVLATVHFFGTGDLRDVAREIQVGDDVLQGDVRLGGASIGYEYGWPSPGAPPTVRGACYGGPLDDLHKGIDSLVWRAWGGQPMWYTNSLEKHHRAWPVVLEYDADKRVTIVYVDGVNVTTSATRPQGR